MLGRKPGQRCGLEGGKVSDFLFPVGQDDLDDLSGIPRYLQVARLVEAEIRAGQWPPGQSVPSRNQLAQRFGIARETAARAHAWLARVGYLVAVPGVGMVVTPPARWPDAAS